ncbi:hypothetical protein Unana1_05313 [Umbelopsis nana]
MPAVISRGNSMPTAKSMSRTSGRVTKKSAATTTARKQQVCIESFSRETSMASVVDNEQEIRRLEKELTFSCDTLATIVVMIESLQRAYDSRRPDQPILGKTRLDAAERELLAEYDDLDLQMSHLEKKIALMETELADLKNSRPPQVMEFKLEEPTLNSDIFEWDHQLQFVPHQSLSPEQDFVNDQESAAVKIEDVSEWIDWSMDSF